MTLTDTPPASWKDWHHDLFENKLHEMAGRFRRLAALRFGQGRMTALLAHRDHGRTAPKNIRSVGRTRPGMESRLKEITDAFEGSSAMKLNSKEAADRS